MSDTTVKVLFLVAYAIDVLCTAFIVWAVRNEDKLKIFEHKVMKKVKRLLRRMIIRHEYQKVDKAMTMLRSKGYEVLPSGSKHKEASENDYTFFTIHEK